MKLIHSGKRWSSSTRFFALMLALILLLLSGCTGSQQTKPVASEGSGSAEEVSLPVTTEAASESEASESHGTEPEAPGGNDRMIYAHVNRKALKILAAENSSAEAFLDLLKAIYYDVNSWSFTRLGKVQGLSQAELKEILGTGNATVTFSLSEETGETGQFNFEKQTVLLNSGYEMPIIGLGTWTLKGDEAENSVYLALKSGMRLIDTARYYGNEAAVGRGLQKAIDEGIVTREEVFITTKIYGGNYERAGGIIDDALKDLNLDYIDLLLIHQPGYDDEGVYKAMEEAVAAGKLRSIGISNYYTKEQVDEVLSFATIVPAVIQNENHLYYQNSELQEYISQYGIVIESWYPFGGRGHTSEHFGNEVIKELAEKYGKSSAQIILRWQLQAGFIAIPGSSNPEHIAENYDIFDFELTEEDMQRIRDLDRQERYENW